jgi:cyclic nucleotide-binding protein/GNAT acetyltransferase-like protein
VDQHVDMGFDFVRAVSAEEVEAVQRLRYAVYVEELGRYREVADRASRKFAEPEDDQSWIFYARDGDEVVAATRMTWGGEGFSARQIDQYQLAPFLEEIPPALMAVGERSSVLPAYRGTGVLDEMMQYSRPFLDSHDLRLVFGCCEPHLLSLYLGMGQRPYAEHNINSPSAGYLIPLVAFIPDVEALRGVGHVTAPNALPGCVDRVLARGGSVRSQSLSAPREYWSEVRRTLDELHAQGISAFDGFSDGEAERCIARSNVIACAKGDRVLKRGGTARNIFVVLDGTLEVLDDNRVVGVLSTGDAFGEMAFLLERPRAFDVDAATEQTRILSLSEGALRKMIAEDPTVAAKLLLNLSRMLCVRLIKAN